MKIELTQLQADKIIEAVRAKFNETHDGIWLGLLHNLEAQVNWREQKDPYVLDCLKKMFEPTVTDDCFGRSVECQPVFKRVDKLKRNKTEVQLMDYHGIKFLYKKWGYMPQTKNYTVEYEILQPA